MSALDLLAENLPFPTNFESIEDEATRAFIKDLVQVQIDAWRELVDKLNYPVGYITDWGHADDIEQVDGASIYNATITAAQIANATITGTQIASASITSDHIVNATIVGGDIAAATIAGSNIINGTITATQISAATITGTEIADASITSAHIVNATIQGEDIDSAQITSDHIVNATITGGDIAAATIAGSNIVNATITSTQIEDATITGAKIAAATVTGGNIANATITGGKIAAATITGGNLVNQTITAGKIGNLTITASQIAHLTIRGGGADYEIAPNTIAEYNIVANTITAALIAANTITAAEIAANTITASEILANTITAAEIAAGTITASELKGTDFGTLTITSGKLEIDVAAGVLIKSGADITLASGGDLNFGLSDTDPSLFDFGGAYFGGAAATAARGICWWPAVVGAGVYQIGFDPIGNAVQRFSSVSLYGENGILTSMDNGTIHGMLQIDGDASQLHHHTAAGASHVYLGGPNIWLSGDVGIGTASPSSALHIKAGVSGLFGQIVIQNPANDVTSNVAITAYESDGSGNPDQQLWYLGSSTAANENITFLNRRNAILALGTNNNTRMTILGNGNIGIGTVTPQATFQVVETTAGMPYVARIHNKQGVAQDVGVSILFQGGAAGSGLGSIDAAFAGAATTDGAYLAFRTRAPTSGAQTERMRITESGKIGVGLTPTASMPGLAIEAGVLTIKEISNIPEPDINYGKVFTKNDNKLYFQDGAGVQHEIAYA